jgi:hypothetical protein
LQRPAQKLVREHAWHMICKFVEILLFLYIMIK